MLRASEITSLTDTGRLRPDNEDSLFVREPLFVVADGMGGARAGEVASQVAVEAFQEGLPERGTAEERLTEVVQEANRRIHALSREHEERQGMGTTLTAAMLEDASITIAHVGDSRAYLFREGQLQRLTQDHSLVAELVRRGKLTEEQAEEHPQRSIITRALGIEPAVEVDTWSYSARHGDVLLLCSDGLTSMLTEEQIVDVLSRRETLQEAARALIRTANEAGGRDNISVILTRLEEDGAAAGEEVDQATFISPPAARNGGGGRDGAGGEPADAPPRGTQVRPPVPPRRRRTAGHARHARESRLRRPVAALLATVIVLALILSGGYLATRQLFFIGTDAQGIVTIYRGMPYSFLGVDLYETYYVSGVPAVLIPADRRATLLDDHLRSQSNAENVVRSLELGEISG
jgi:serine/threonine protein phosphatase PrpC